MSRTEAANIRMTLTPKAAVALKSQLEIMKRCSGLHLPKDSQSGDKLTIDYKFQIRYLGDTAAALKAVLEICNHPDVIKDADCNLIQKGVCLLHETLEALKKIGAK